MGRDTKDRVDQTVVERSWRERGFSCGLWVDPPGQVWADYVHDTDELVMVLEGDVEFERCGKVTAGSGYIGAMQLVADIAARFRVHSPPGGSRPKNRSPGSKMRIREHG